MTQGISAAWHPALMRLLTAKEKTMNVLVNTSKTKMADQVACIKSETLSITGMIIGGDSGCVGSALMRNPKADRWYAAAAGTLTSLPSDVFISYTY